MEWTAVGAIATAVAVIVALIANYRTNKDNEENRKLQVALLRQQRAQKKLDEMVQMVMQLSKGINPLEIFDCSERFFNQTFTIDDMRFLDHLAMEGAGWSINLTLQMEALSNPDSAWPVLNCLGKMWNDYILWSHSITTLFQYSDLYAGNGKNARGLPQPERLIKDMVNRILEVDPNVRLTLDELLKEKNLQVLSKKMIELFGKEISKEIQLHKNVLREKMIEFIRGEQERIDDMVT